jgi:MoxR-like ATPase
MAPGELLEMQRAARTVHVSGALLDYVQALVAHSRQSQDFAAGLSPRAALALLAGARAWALMADRNHVLPEDVQAVLPGVVGHRLHLAGEAARTGTEVGRRLLEAVAIP